MKQVGIFEGKTRFSALVEEAKNGEIIVITKHGEPVAQITRFTKNRSRAEAMKRVLSSKATLGKMSIRDLIEEGRRY